MLQMHAFDLAHTDMPGSEWAELGELLYDIPAHIYRPPSPERHVEFPAAARKVQTWLGELWDREEDTDEAYEARVQHLTAKVEAVCKDLAAVELDRRIPAYKMVKGLLRSTGAAYMPPSQSSGEYNDPEPGDLPFKVPEESLSGGSLESDAEGGVGGHTAASQQAVNDNHHIEHVIQNAASYKCLWRSK